MSATLSKAQALTRLNTVQPRMAKVRPDSPTALIDVNQPEILALIQETHGELGIKQDYAAARAGVKPSQYSAALNGHGNFAATWLWAQEDTFLLRVMEKVMETRGLTPADASAVRRRRIVELIDLLLAESA